MGLARKSEFATALDTICKKCLISYKVSKKGVTRVVERRFTFSRKTSSSLTNMSPVSDFLAIRGDSSTPKQESSDVDHHSHAAHQRRLSFS